MNDWTRRALRRIYAEASAAIVIEDGLVRYDRPGHTRQIAHLPYCHEGRYSAGYYALETLLAADTGPEAATAQPIVRRSAAQRLDTLRALSRLQVTDRGDAHYGAFRWYAEENAVQDSNAAFFILMPLASLRLRAPEAVPAEHRQAIDGMLRPAAAWFERECREPELYYPNKTLSDGAMLLAIAFLLGDAERIELAADYFERWAEYTTRRGWGWGENMSLVYQSVMLNALEIARPLLRDFRPGLAERLDAHRASLLEILRFHDGGEFVPTIRSYNFGGEVRRPSLAWLIAGIAGTGESDPDATDAERSDSDEAPHGSAESPAEFPFGVNDLPALLLFGASFRVQGTRSEAGAPSAALPVPRVRRERVFDDAYAYSWIGRKTRLGSLNAFPIMPGSYQHETWGLGWQSFPLSAAAEGGQVSYARWYVRDGETERTHPAESYKTAYLMPALFRQRPYPAVRTHAAQHEYALLAVRTLEPICRPAAEIADEWIFHRHPGETLEVRGGDGRLWHVLRYAGAAIAIAPLRGIRSGEADAAASPEAAAAPHAGVLRPQRGADGCLKLRQVLHAGGASERTPCAPRLEAGWAVLCLDEAADEAAIRARLDVVTIEDDEWDDREVPRDPHERIRLVRLLESGRERVALRFDPHHPGRI